MAETTKKKRGCTGYLALACLLSLMFLMVCVDSTNPRITTAARQAKAFNMMIQIQTADLAYDTEYGEWPIATDNARLIKILTGDNLRRIPFLSVRPVEMDGDGRVIDPWGTPYRMSVGADSKIQVTSAGPDKIFGTADDLTNPN